MVAEPLVGPGEPIPDFPLRAMLDEWGETVLYSQQPPHTLTCAEATGGECGRRCSCPCHTRARRALVPK